MTVSFLNNVRSKWRTAAVWMGHVGASTASSSSGNTLVWDRLVQEMFVTATHTVAYGQLTAIATF
jgi:hypothetical protein